MDEIDKKKVRDIAIKAKELNINAGYAFELLIEGINKIPDQLQMMVDQVVIIQKIFPMPQEGWQSFINDLEHTNKKHGLNLQIKPELLK